MYTLVYTWVKFRALYSSGPGEWEYEEMPPYGCGSIEKDIEEFKYSLQDRYYTDEHWRGIELMIENPPKSELENLKGIALRHIKAIETYIERIDKVLLND